MLLAGDEISRTQQGNNNAFSQDNPISWLNWEDADQDMLAFVQELTKIRRRYLQLRASTWLKEATSSAGVHWLDRDAASIPSEAWGRTDKSLLCMLQNGNPPILIIYNGAAREQNVTLPTGRWRVVLDTAQAEPFPGDSDRAGFDESLRVGFRSVVLLEKCGPDHAPV